MVLHLLTVLFPVHLIREVGREILQLCQIYILRPLPLLDKRTKVTAHGVISLLQPPYLRAN